MEERDFFTVLDEEGKEQKAEVMFTFDSDETNKSYVVYQTLDAENKPLLDEEGNIQVFASTYDPKNPDGTFGPIESEKEWKIIENLLEGLKEGEESEQ